jgi:hypothetical protein
VDSRRVAAARDPAAVGLRWVQAEAALVRADQFLRERVAQAPVRAAPVSGLAVERLRPVEALRPVEVLQRVVVAEPALVARVRADPPAPVDP